jgi:NTE family protein
MNTTEPTIAIHGHREAKPRNPKSEAGQIVLVLQGGGALGAYQAGVYEALHERGLEPDWVIGTSIGAINASLIAGNPAEARLHRLQEFWYRMQRPRTGVQLPFWPDFSSLLDTWQTIVGGIPGFFQPNSAAFLSPHLSLGTHEAGFYSTRDLDATLSELVDFPRIAANAPRLTVGAANVRTSKMRYFDSRDMPITKKHIMASGALPPAFPAVFIDGEGYWDGGILSNTPIEAVFDDNPRRNSLIFSTHVWNAHGSEPDTLWEVFHRQKNVQYASRTESHVSRQQQIHRLRHVISLLAAEVPEARRRSPEVRELAAYGCLTRMHVVQLQAPELKGESHFKDIDFSPNGIAERWQAGYRHTARALDSAPWAAECDPLEGLILHDPLADQPAPVAMTDKKAQHPATPHEEGGSLAEAS